MIVGKNHPNTSYVFAMSETNIRLVMFSIGGNSVTVIRKWSIVTFHSIPSALAYSEGSDIEHDDRESLRSGGMC